MTCRKSRIERRTFSTSFLIRGYFEVARYRERSKKRPYRNLYGACIGGINSEGASPGGGGGGGEKRRRRRGEREKITRYRSSFCSDPFQESPCPLGFIIVSRESNFSAERRIVFLARGGQSSSRHARGRQQLKRRKIRGCRGTSGNYPRCCAAPSRRADYFVITPVERF